MEYCWPETLGRPAWTCPVCLDSSATTTEEVEGTAGSQLPLVGDGRDARFAALTPRSCGGRFQGLVPAV